MSLQVFGLLLVSLHHREEKKGRNPAGCSLQNEDGEGDASRAENAVRKEIKTDFMMRRPLLSGRPTTHQSCQYGGRTDEVHGEKGELLMSSRRRGRRRPSEKEEFSKVEARTGSLMRCSLSDEERGE